MPASRRLLRWHAWIACLLLTTLGCASVAPRFPQDIQTSFARDSMRKMTTESLELYYPEHLRGPALRMAARLEHCVERLREDTWRKTPRDKLLVYLTSADFNNAYVVPDFASTPQQMVMPAHMTLELFHFFGLGEVDVGDVACHEAVHYVQLQQTNGLWGFLNTFTGGLFQPNVFTESWFLEGLATYYEGRFNKDTGRPHSPVWRGWFDSVVQARDGRMDPGFLSPENREMDPFGGNYLTGMHFVEYLATKYGEAKLWKLVDNQGTSIVPPLAVTLRFKSVYGKDIGSLFADFSKDLSEQLIPRTRPATQQKWIPDAGYFSRLTSHPESGVTALVSVGRKSYSRLTVREADGRVRFERPLVDLLPFRRWVLGSPTLVSGMSFSADGTWLYLVMADVNAVGAYDAKLWRVDARTGDVVRVWDDVKGMGGSITPDGSAYVYVHVDGDTANLMRLELESGRQEPLTHFDASASVGPPAISPDGSKMVFPVAGPQGWDLAEREADGSLRWLTRDGLFNYSPRWLDAEHIVFLRKHLGRLQVHMMTVSTREMSRITDAPFLALDVSPVGGGEVAFLNRDGASFTIDRAPLIPIPEMAPSESPATVSAPTNISAPPLDDSAAEQPVSPPPLMQVPATTAQTAPTSEPAPAPLAPEELVAFPGTPAPSSPETGTAPSTPAPAPSPSEPPGGEFEPFPAAPADAPVLPSEHPLATSQPTQPQDTGGLESPVVAPPPDPGKAVELLSDEPYSPLEGLLIPELRVPYLWVATNTGTTDDEDDLRIYGGVVLSGKDRLGFHSYALAVDYTTQNEAPTLSLAYGNAQLAPWYLQAAFSRARQNDRTDLQAVAVASRTFWTTPVSIGLLALNREFDADDQFPRIVTRLIGPEVAASYFAGDATSYGGLQRGLGISMSGAIYPRAFASDKTLGDVRLGLDGFFSGWMQGMDHIQLSAVGRYLPGAPDGLLEVGGLNAGQTWYSSRRATETAPLPLRLQPGIAFSEYLRGYEDHTIRAKNVLIGGATYRNRIIVDYGWASTLWLLPSLFVSNLELEVFGTLARTDTRENHGAFGANVAIQFTMGQTVPFSIFYQFARRFPTEDRLGDLHLVGLGL